MPRRSADHLDYGFQIDADPRFFVHLAGFDHNAAEWCFERQSSVTIRDARGATSDKTASLDFHPLTGLGPAVWPTNDDEERTLEEDIFLQR